MMDDSEDRENFSGNNSTPIHAVIVDASTFNFIDTQGVNTLLQVGTVVLVVPLYWGILARSCGSTDLASLEGFSLGNLVFLPLQNRLPVKNIWLGCCALGSFMTVWW